MIYRVSVGTLVRDLLRDRSTLAGWRSRVGPMSLLQLAPPDRLIEMDLEILASDEFADVHESVVDFWAEPYDWPDEVPQPPLDLEVLGRLAPRLPTWRLVKAVGRMRPSAGTRALLVSVLSGGRRPRIARLAAASALTRDAHASSVSALRSAHEGLDAGDRTRPGSRLLARCEHRLAGSPPSVELDPLAVLDAVEDDLRRFAAADEPSPERSARRREAVAVLLRIASRPTAFAEPWETHSDLSRVVRRITVDGMSGTVWRMPTIRLDEGRRILALVRGD